MTAIRIVRGNQIAPSETEPIVDVAIDQSGRIEVLTVDTAFALSNRITTTLLIPAEVKRRAFHAIKTRGVKRKMIGIRMFAAAIFLLLESHLQTIERVTIDVEFAGWESEIKGLLLLRIRERRPDFPAECIAFGQVGKKTQPHKIALATFRGERIPNRRVTFKELIKLC